MRSFDRKSSVTRKEAEETLSVSQTMAGRVLKHLMSKEKVIVVGKGSRTRYELMK